MLELIKRSSKVQEKNMSCSWSRAQVQMGNGVQLGLSVDITLR